MIDPPFQQIALRNFSSARRNDAFTHDMDDRLTPFLFDYLEGLRQGGGKFAWFSYLDPVTAIGLHEHFVSGLNGEAGKGKILRAHSPTLRVERARCVLRRIPAAIVTDYDQDGQIVHGGNHMASAGAAEDIAPVSYHGNDRLVRRCNLDAERGPHSPAQTSGRRMAEVAPRGPDGEMLQPEVILVDHNRFPVRKLMETV